MARVLHVPRLRMPDEFIGHEATCGACGTVYVVDSSDDAYQHRAIHDRLGDESRQTRTVHTPCPECRAMCVLTTSINHGESYLSSPHAAYDRLGSASDAVAASLRSPALLG